MFQPTRFAIRRVGALYRQKVSWRTFSNAPILFASPIPKRKPLIDYRKSAFFRLSGKVVKYGLVAVMGATSYYTYTIYRELHPGQQNSQSSTFENGSPKKRLIILGTGWGAVSLLQSMDTTLYNVTVVSPRNYFLFTPFLTSTPVGAIDINSIMEPIRHILRSAKGEVKFLEASATDIDPENKTIKVVNSSGDERVLSYDYLVMSVGAKTTTFNIPGVRENAFFIKEAHDSIRIREKIMKNIEHACFLDPSDPKRKQLLSFVVVGGGPTGVEMAAELQDFVNESLTKWMPDIAKDITVHLVEGLPHILNMFDKNIITYSEEFILKSKINLILNTFVKGVDADNVHIEQNKVSKQFPYGILIWATGNQPRDISVTLSKKLGEHQSERRGLQINEKLQVLGAEDSIFAIGDCTYHAGLAPTAQVAHQEGAYLSGLLAKLNEIDQLSWKIAQVGTSEKRAIKLKEKMREMVVNLPDFVYDYKGSLAYIGAERAVADLKIAGKDYQLRGSPFAFFFWKMVYLSMCVSFRNCLVVSMDWFKTYFFGRGNV